MDIKFQGQYDKASFYKAVRLANTSAGSQKRVLWFMLVFALGAMILLIYRAAVSGDWAGNAILMGVGALMIIIISVISLQPYFIAQKLWAEPGTRRKLKGRVTNHSVVYMLDEGRNEILWARINRIRIGDNLVTMVRDDGLLLVFPRRFFRRDLDWRRFLEIARSIG